MNKYTVSHDEYVVSHRENKLLDFFDARKHLEVIKELIDTFHSMLCLILNSNLNEIEHVKIGRYLFIGIICDFAMDFDVDRKLVDVHELLTEDLYGKLHSLANMKRKKMSRQNSKFVHISEKWFGAGYLTDGRPQGFVSCVVRYM